MHAWAVLFLWGGLPGAVSAEVRLRGDDFIQGSAAVDAVSYLETLLAQVPANPENPAAVLPGWTTDFSARWAAASFEVWASDRLGRPLLGPSASGLVDGSLMAYRLGVVFPLGVTWLRVFFGLDYFVATHIDDFGRLFDAWYSANSIGEFFSFGWTGPFTGGKATGFGALAFQILPGLEFLLPWYEIRLRTGVLFKARDPIHESGKFLSTFYVEKDSWTGVIGKWHGDYPSREAIPEGVSGLGGSEFYVSASVLGLGLDSLFSPAGALALLRASGVWDTAWAWFRPGLSWFDRLYSPLEGFSAWGGDLEAEYRFGTAQEWRLGHLVKLLWTPEDSFAPLRFDEGRLWLAFTTLKGAVGLKVKPDGSLLPGWELGLETPPESPTRFGFTVSRNYAGSRVGGLSLEEVLLFSVWMQL